MRLLATLLLSLAVAQAEDPPDQPPEEDHPPDTSREEQDDPGMPSEDQDPPPDTSLGKEVEKYLEETEPPSSGVPMDGRWFHAPLFESEDYAFLVRLRARLMVDAYWATSDDYDSSVTADGVFVRQARLGVMGHIYNNVIYELEFEFSNGDARPRDVFVGLRQLGAFGRLKFGHMREPFGLDATTPIPFHAFLERASSTRAFGLGRSPGVRLHNRTLGGRLTWWAGIFRDGDASGSALGNSGYSFTVKVTGLPLREAGRLLHVGFSFSLRDPLDGMTRLRARAGPATGPQLVDTGQLPADGEARFGWAAAFRLRSLTLQSEAYLVRVSGPGTDATFQGWFVMASYWLTGETATYSEWNAVWDRVLPRRNLHDGSGGKGAWMLALRFDRVDLTDGGIDGGMMNSFTFGVTWMWNPNTRVKLDLVYADITGGPLGSGTIWYMITRFQFDF
jgi:phosphate-selective porin OprO/OprP